MAGKRKKQIVRIRENKSLRPGYYKISVGSDSLARVCRPGQFFMLTVPGVFLKRPLSVYSASNGKIEFLYKAVGKGTRCLSELKPGGEIEIIGPLGNGYDLAAAKGKEPVFVAGGTGIASLSFLAEKLKSKGILYYGAKNKNEIVGLEKFKNLGWKIVLSTDDGSSGDKGFVTDSCNSGLSGAGRGKRVMFCCGPHAMMKKCKEIAAGCGIQAFASLEEIMACGTGICQGCVAKISGEYKRVCSDGPVFGLGEIDEN